MIREAKASLLNDILKDYNYVLRKIMEDGPKIGLIKYKEDLNEIVATYYMVELHNEGFWQDYFNNDYLIV